MTEDLQRRDRAPTSTAALPGGRPPATPPDLQAVNLTKHFGSLVAVDGVSLHLKPGTVHALLGENGAGKSTLAKCIMGFYAADGGEILVDGTPAIVHSPRDACRYGLGMVYQHFTVIPAMTVAENLFLMRPDIPFAIDWKQECDRLQAFMESAPFHLDLHTPVHQLAAGQKQKLEILKQLYLHNRILILDEPTTALTPGEADEVLALLRAQVDAGRLSVLIVTHKFREVMGFADEVTVLRKGKFAGGGAVGDLGVADLARMMLGEERVACAVNKIDKPNDKVDPSRPPVPILEVQNLSVRRDNGLPAVSEVTLRVHRGEIVGIAGVAGNGQRELVEVLAGQRLPVAGEIRVNGQPYSATRQEMAEHAVFCLPEEPLRNACVPHMSVAENLALRTFDRPPQAKWGWLLVFSAMRQFARQLVDLFSIKTPSVDTPVGNLSGGNVQRTVLARELSSPKIDLLIAVNPCFGLDFAAVEYIHDQLLAARHRGVAILLVSEDLDEILALSDRVLVMSNGTIAYESAIAEADLTEIGQRMAGH